eukprot:CAMPEP_0174903280 /NCGR_PEP_ID=MMETSP0167-20121228/43072_1 /TAXON_ID=38298 /ORGANISM="Rhodella maculata, Strain CCMP736" /LENGTH=90 /DNA_ID=CAMNT_0016145571 /DNA_START=264 /DNA_END=536 /DNA_ORIENTATION=-
MVFSFDPAPVRVPPPSHYQHEIFENIDFHIFGLTPAARVRACRRGRRVECAAPRAVGSGAAARGEARARARAWARARWGEKVAVAVGCAG